MPTGITDASAVVILCYALFLVVNALVKMARRRNGERSPNRGNPNSGTTNTKLDTIITGQNSLQDSLNALTVTMAKLLERIPPR